MKNSEAISDQAIYQIRLRSHVEEHWAGWFEGMSITYDDQDNTLLTGLVADQPALFGLLYKIRDLGLALLSVQRQSDPSVEN